MLMITTDRRQYECASFPHGDMSTVKIDQQLAINIKKDFSSRINIMKSEMTRAKTNCTLQNQHVRKGPPAG